MRNQGAGVPVRLLLAVIALGVFLVPQASAQNQSATAGTQPTATVPQAQTSPAATLGVYVYPQNNQAPAQQQKDETECYGWAREQTGIDPTAPAVSSSKQPAEAPKGGAVKGAARGAAAGTAIGAIRDDPEQGAAVGATAGAIRGRRAQKKAQKQTEKQAKADAQAAQQQQLGKFRNAFSACLDARHYSVK